jgi:ankyrin repeat protein
MDAVVGCRWGRGGCRLLFAVDEPDAKDDGNQTPLSIAVDGGHEVVVKMLLDTQA